MNASISVEVLKALAVTAELTGTQLSEAAARVFASDLAAYPPDQVLGALNKCRREIRHRLTVADVVARLDDGRPTPDEAWAMIPHDEAQSAVITQEMASAWGIAREADDRVSARMAFLSAYRRLVQEARDSGAPAHWFPSLGTDPHGRNAALEEAVRLGRLTQKHAENVLPATDFSPQIASEIMAKLTQKTGAK